MYFNKILPKILFFSLASLLIGACEKEEQAVDNVSSRITMYDVFASNLNFSTLRSAIDRAGLKERFSSETSSFTFFAPNNAAFTAKGYTVAKADSIFAANPAGIKSLLEYLIIDSPFTSAALPDTGYVEKKSLNGQKLYLIQNATGVYLNGPTLVANKDIIIKNGVFYEIPALVVVPVKTVLDTINVDANLTFLKAAIARANISSLYTQSGYSYLLPNNAAFTSGGYSSITAINAASPTVLEAILKNHILPTTQFTQTITEGSQASTLQGSTLTFTLVGGLKVKNAAGTATGTLTVTNILFTNGVTHRVDKLLTP